MKKYIALLLCLAMALTMAACGSKSTPTETSGSFESSEETAGMLEVNGAPDDDPTWQLGMIEENAAIWLMEDIEDTATRYSVTDYDHNGLLEIQYNRIDYATSTTTMQLWEVAADRSGLVEIALPEEMPKDIYDAIYCYTDGVTYCYSLGEYVPGEEGVYRERVSLFSKQGNAVECVPVGSSYMEYVDDHEEYRCFDVAGNELSPEAFSQLAYTVLDYTEEYTAIRYSVFPEWYEGDIQTMIVTSFEGWGREQDEGSWFELMVYPNAFSQEYQSMNGGSIHEVDSYETGLNVPVRLISSEDDVTISVEYGEWNWLPRTFRPVREICSFTVEAGEVYEFTAPLGDTMPLARIHAVSGNRHAFYYLQTNGQDGLPGVEYVYPGYPEIPTEEDDFIELCKAYAGVAAKYEDHYGLQEEHVWDALVNGVTLSCMKWSDPDSQGNIYLSQETWDLFLNALYPYETILLPAGTSDITVRDDPEEPYIISAYLNAEVGSAYVDSVELAGNGDYGCAIIILPEMGDMDVMVNFRLADDWMLHPDYPWVISDAAFNYG